MATENPNLAAEPRAETVVLEIPRDTFDMVVQVVGILKQAIDASNSKVKADEKMAGAEAKAGEVMTGLEGFGAELDAATDRGLGL